VNPDLSGRWGMAATTRPAKSAHFTDWLNSAFTLSENSEFLPFLRDRINRAAMVGF
jgi:hypothetical protein